MAGILTQNPMIRRRKPLRSKTADTLFQILSFCYENQLSDRGDTDIGPITKDDVPLDCADILPNDSQCQEDTSMHETRVVLDTHEDGLLDEQPKLAEQDHNIVEETTELCHNGYTDKDVNEGEISGDFMDFTPKDSIGIKSQLESDNNLIPLSPVTVENVGKDMTGIVNKKTRNLVDYSEIADSSLRRSPRVRLLESNLKDGKTRNEDNVNPLKRQGSFTLEERAHKKEKMLVDIITGSENLNSVGEHHEDADNEKKKKRVVTQESKAKKKRNARIKRAEERIKNGVNRPKLQVIVKEKKISICRHYMHGKCTEGWKCKFSHDSIPLTKSKACFHFARNACMKGDDCPYDHQLSKYPCNKLLSTGQCDRGSNCLFSHEAQPIEPVSDALNKSIPDQESKEITKTPPVIPNSIDITPKVFTRPPKGVTFLSQKKSPIDPEAKEITKTPDVTQDPKEITKTPPVVPRGINFLSFGKKPDPDSSNGGFSFKKSPLGSKSDPGVNVVNEVKVDFPTDKPSFSQNPIPMMSFMSSTSQKAVQSTLAFASKFEAGVKTKKPGI